MADISVVPLDEISGSARWDAEYFQPGYKALSAKLAAANPIPIGEFAFVTDGIHGSPEWVEEKGFTYLSAKCVKNNVFDLKSAGRISQAQHAANPRTQARLNDVLITTVGTVGNTAVVYADILPANMDRHLGIIRISQEANVDPYYLSTFLNSKYGRFQTARESTGNVQANLFIDKIRSLLVPFGNYTNNVAKLTREAYEKYNQADSLYPEAEKELLERIGWCKLMKPTKNYYVEEFSELEERERIDAEHFHPDYKRLCKHLSSIGADAIETVCPFNKHGIQPPYVEDGKVPIVTQRQFRPTTLDMSAVELFTDSSFTNENPEFVLRKWDVLTYCVSAGVYLGQTNIYLEDTPAVAASFVTILRTAILNPAYLALFLNSSAGTLQSNALKRGTSPFYLYPRDLAKVLVFIPKNRNGQIDTEWQKKLADNVIRASKAKAEAQAIMERAKKAVEDSIDSSAH
ncbi:MAG: hypothetical protein ABR911_01570 [Syntrophales bacterium]